VSNGAQDFGRAESRYASSNNTNAHDPSIANGRIRGRPTCAFFSDEAGAQSKLSARYQRRRRAVDRCSLATPLRAQYDGNENEALRVKV